MDRNQIDERHMVARYLADKLTGEERAAFEAYLVEHPDLMQELENAARLKVGLQRLQDSGRLTQALGSRPWYRQPRILAMAASLAAVAVGVSLWLGGRAPAPPLMAKSLAALNDAAGTALAVAQTRFVVRTRSLEPDVQIEAARQPTAVELRVLPEFVPEPPVFRVALLELDAKGGEIQRATLAGLSPDSAGNVVLYLDASQLRPARYVISLSPDSAAPRPDQTSRFTVVVQPLR